MLLLFGEKSKYKIMCLILNRIQTTHGVFSLPPPLTHDSSCLHVLPEVHVLERVPGDRYAVAEPLPEAEDVSQGGP